VSELTFRPAAQYDCTQLALFADMATRRLTSHLWGLSALPGQSAFEVGRTAICGNSQHFSHFSNWRVCLHQSQIVGAYNAYVIPLPLAHAAPVAPVIRALNELKDMAAGSWYISAAAIHPEVQGRGFGKLMLAEAEAQARQNGAADLTLMVGSFNTGAHRLYLGFGFVEQARRPFMPFPGSDSDGEWILMGKSLR
jgi:ribosomal protein S18 acetylase RimI-like enzyme